MCTHIQPSAPATAALYVHVAPCHASYTPTACMHTCTRCTAHGCRLRGDGLETRLQRNALLTAYRAGVICDHKEHVAVQYIPTTTTAAAAAAMDDTHHPSTAQGIPPDAPRPLQDLLPHTPPPPQDGHDPYPRPQRAACTYYAGRIVRLGVLASLSAGAAAGAVAGAAAHGARHAVAAFELALLRGGYLLKAANPPGSLRLRYANGSRIVDDVRRAIAHVVIEDPTGLMRLEVAVYQALRQHLTTRLVCVRPMVSGWVAAARAACLVGGAWVCITLIAAGAYLCWRHASARARTQPDPHRIVKRPAPLPQTTAAAPCAIRRPIA